MVWIPGANEWRDGRYVWIEGHWEKERRGHRWHAGHWDRDGDRHVWHGGDWERDEDVPPPPPVPAISIAGRVARILAEELGERFDATGSERAFAQLAEGYCRLPA